MHDEGDTVPSGPDPLDVLIVGAGFGGLYALLRARQVGLRALVVEAGDDVGGTWYWNCYPGARCDVESVEYSYGFSEELQQEWVWTERYAGQPEILRYARHVADRFDLRQDIRFGTRVLSAAFDEAGACWRARLDDGRDVSAAFVVLATGCLSAANVPDIPGLDTFAGPVLHTGRWPRQEVDFSGRRVGIIGTGSSAIQAVPIIARAAAELVVFQRTASYSIPAHNRPLADEELGRIKADYAGFRARNRAMPGGFGAHLEWTTRSALTDTAAQRQAQYEDRWVKGGFAFVGSYGDTSTNMDANTLAAEFVREKIRRECPGWGASLCRLPPPAGWRCLRRRPQRRWGS
jgi:cation diffusion facilitator CzcD-associated flavoprotein CzcO